MLSTLDQWLGQHTGLLGILVAASIALLLLSIVATPRLVAALPGDYLVRKAIASRRHPLRVVVVGGLRAIVGTVLIAAGLVMLIIPGPGLVTLLIGLSVIPFPGKHHLFRRIATQKSVYKSLNWMRRRHGQGPFVHPSTREVDPY